MLKTWFEFTQQLFTLTKDVAESRERIKEVQKEVRELAMTVQALTYRVDQMQRESEREREMLMLRLENALLRMDKGLPAVREEVTPAEPSADEQH